MGSGAFDVYCPTKRVFFRPSADDTVRVGDQVCYNSDIELDHKERAADPSHLGLTQDTYEEGAQEFTGRLFIVEKPATANLHAYAGVVKSLGPNAGGDNDMIEIWVPTEGAVVLVMTDQNCTNERTVMGIRNGAYEASYPEGGGQIGIALETKDRSSIDGLVWMRFQKGISRNANADWLIDDEADGANVIANYLRYESAQASGTFSAFWVRSKVSGGAYANSTAGGGITAYLRGECTASLAVSITAVHIQMVLSAGTYTSGVKSALHVKMAVDGTTMTSGKLCVLVLESMISDEHAAGHHFWMYLERNGTDAPNALLTCGSIGDLPMSAHVTDAISHSITIDVNGVPYYIMVTSDGSNKS